MRITIECSVSTIDRPGTPEDKVDLMRDWIKSQLNTGLEVFNEVDEYQGLIVLSDAKVTASRMEP